MFIQFSTAVFTLLTPLAVGFNDCVNLTFVIIINIKGRVLGSRRFNRNQSSRRLRRRHDFSSYECINCGMDSIEGTQQSRCTGVWRNSSTAKRTSNFIKKFDNIFCSLELFLQIQYQDFCYPILMVMLLHFISLGNIRIVL